MSGLEENRETRRIWLYVLHPNTSLDNHRALEYVRHVELIIKSANNC